MPAGPTSPRRPPSGSGAVRSAVARATTVRVRARPGPGRDPQQQRRRRRTLSSRALPPAARRAARAGAGALGLSTARRAAVLAVVICAVALTVAVPLRNYVTQRHEIAAVTAEAQRVAGEVAASSARRDELADPARLEALARERLGYARPGETPYRVELPGDDVAAGDPAAGAAAAPREDELPWYVRVGRETLGTGG